ncbi:hypothetical protein D3C72_1295380 [compost metagenome]
MEVELAQQPHGVGSLGILLHHQCGEGQVAVEQAEQRLLVVGAIDYQLAVIGQRLLLQSLLIALNGALARRGALVIQHQYQLAMALAEQESAGALGGEGQVVAEIEVVALTHPIQLNEARVRIQRLFGTEYQHAVTTPSQQFIDRLLLLLRLIGEAHQHVLARPGQGPFQQRQHAGQTIAKLGGENDAHTIRRLGRQGAGRGIGSEIQLFGGLQHGQPALFTHAARAAQDAGDGGFGYIRKARYIGNIGHGFINGNRLTEVHPNIGQHPPVRFAC